MCVCVYVHACVLTHVPQCRWRSEDDLWVLVFSFDHLSSGDCSQGIRLVSKCPYNQMYLTRLVPFLNKPSLFLLLTVYL